MVKCKKCEEVRERDESLFCSAGCRDLYNANLNEALIGLLYKAEVLSKLRDELFGKSWRDG